MPTPSLSFILPIFAWNYTKKLDKKDLHDSDNHDGVVTHLEPDILECEVLGLRKHHYEQS